MALRLIKLLNSRFAWATMLVLTSLLLSGRGIYLRTSKIDVLNWLPKNTDDIKIDFSLTESAKTSGLEFKHQRLSLPSAGNIEEWITSFGASVAVVDVNHDDFMDVYLTQPSFGSSNKLFLNNKDGTFRPDNNFHRIDLINDHFVSIRPLFFDCNNDGRKDLFLLNSTCPKVWKQGRQDHFEEVRQDIGTTACEFSEAAAPYDFDGDSFTDVITGGINGDSISFRTLPQNIVSASNGSSIIRWRNNGKCQFSPETLDLNGHFFYHSFGIGDLRGTGNHDLWAATDFNTDKVLLNINLKPTAFSVGGALSRSGMNSEIIHLEGNENPYVFVTHVFHLGYHTGGNALWQYNGDKFFDHAISKGLHECGWSWGARAIDLNNDGLLDLAVANGYLSGKENKDYWFPFSVLGGSSSHILTNPKKWPPMQGANFSGNEKDCLYLNLGNEFIDVSKLIDFDLRRQDGRAVAAIDTLNKGTQDLIVVNHNGELDFYRLDIKNSNNWIGFDLSGEQNREAIGATIHLKIGEKSYRRDCFNSNSYSSQSDPRVHFGLGKNVVVDRAWVRWANGKIVEIPTQSLGINKYNKIWESP